MYDGQSGHYAYGDALSLMKLRYLILLFHVCSITLLAQKEYIPILDKHETKFRDSLEYQLEDFNFAWDIVYFELLGYDVEMDKKDTYRLDEEVRFHTVFQSTSKHFSIADKKQRRWLAGAVMIPSYFWQLEVPPFPIYSFKILIFKGKQGEKGNLKAIETRDEIRQMLGEIDTEAELLLWLYSSSSYRQRAYSYKKIDDLYRVRFLDFFSPTCSYHEYFKYYDREGSLKKTEEIKRFHDKNCEPVTP